MAKNLRSTIFCSTLCSVLKNKRTMKKELTKEDELIEAIRMYKRSFPNGYPRLLWYAQELFDEITSRK